MTRQLIAEIELLRGCVSMTAAWERQALDAEVNLRETFEAMAAMRDSINEHIPLPSLESDLAHGPSNAVFCEVVAREVIAEVERLRQTARSAIDVIKRTRTHCDYLAPDYEFAEHIVQDIDAFLAAAQEDSTSE